jgi:hypothetical protein
VNANLNKLSFAAPENCVQKNGAKRRWRSRANWLGCAAGCTAAGAVSVVIWISSCAGSCMAGRAPTAGLALTRAAHSRLLGPVSRTQEGTILSSAQLAGHRNTVSTPV